MVIMRNYAILNNEYFRVKKNLETFENLLEIVKIHNVLVNIENGNLSPKKCHNWLRKNFGPFLTTKEDPYQKYFKFIF